MAVKKQAPQSILIISVSVYIVNMNTKILQNLGKNLKKIRLENNMTQEALAEKVNIHPTYVGKLEAGKNNVSIKLLFKISRALNVRLPEVFDFDK